MLEVQAADLGVRRQELEVRSQELLHNKEYAVSLLEAQERDRENERKHQQEIAKQRSGGSLVVFLLILVFAAVALYLNKDEVVKDIVKIVIPAVFAGLGGYQYGKNQGLTQSTDQSQ
ncbi:MULTISPECIES: hypothetical protein [Chromobacterium]|uniref:Uncharacterized protein n=1 Tax=Chromobacterium rhizoryzae TaxID=1778675 RepID=A0AAD0RQV7_9NEIS|nr:MULTISPECIES: hypothetical protein [Chromobacterium]AXT46334.1 hypothetical protein D1345_09105 [Chromobacterium rhizoryzae]MDH0340070.1 hypothetical protein [Chromobacterium haemolyticum]OQS40411.1 hypothetical protein B0T40_01175 [Chromobacterium haemolyticum]PTU70204.1 hypothetical protein DBB33_12490 [Chromobacterium haemolyticum]